MTLIVALEGKDGLALASDSRDTFGDPRQVRAQNDTTQKLFKFSDSSTFKKYNVFCYIK